MFEHEVRKSFLKLFESNFVTLIAMTFLCDKQANDKHYNKCVCKTSKHSNSVIHTPTNAYAVYDPHV